MLSLLIALCILLPGAVRAASIALEVVPAEPTTESFIQVGLTVQGCVLVEGFSYERIGSTFEVRVQTPDYCDPDAVMPEMFLDIGYLPPGMYTFEYYGCGFAPPGQILCTQTGEETITVRGLAAPQSIPALSKWAALVLASTLTLLGVAAAARLR